MTDAAGRNRIARARRRHDDVPVGRCARWHRLGVAAAAGAALLTLVACQSIALAPPGAFDAQAFGVELVRAWSVIPVRTGDGRAARMLTVDGPLLNRLYLFGSLPDGDSLLYLPDRDLPVPTYQPTMTELELVEFVTDSLALADYTDLVTRDVRLESFDGEAGVAFGFSASTAESLNVAGEALLAKTDSGLNLILFIAPSEYYFDAFATDLDAVFASVGAAPP